MNDPTKKPKRGSWQLWIMLAVTVIPMVGAYVAYFTGIGVPDERVNEGELLLPAKNVKDLLEGPGDAMPSFDNNYQWRLLIPVSESCDETCEENLYLTRQVHIRLGEKAERVERYAINLGAAQGAEFLQSIAQEHPKLKTIDVSRQQWDQWLEGSNAPADLEAHPYYILVDQVGFAMMFYTAEHDGNQLLKDIKRVLRYSPAE